MNEKIFNQGLRSVETGLQGKFQTKFIDFLWKVVKDAPDEAWDRCCTKIGLGLKKTDDLVAGDFMGVLREISEEQAHRDSMWKFRADRKGAPDWKGMAEKICADPAASDLSKGIAQRLASRKGGAAEAVRGGEKYRRQG